MAWPSEAGSLGLIARRSSIARKWAPRSRFLNGPFWVTVAYSTRRSGSVTTVTATTNLAGTVYYHWYLDGRWVGMTTSNRYSFALGPGDVRQVDCVPTNDPYFDYAAAEPQIPDSRAVLWWIRSTDSDVLEYLVEEQKDGGDWTEIATVEARAGQWDYRIDTPRLDDLTDYAWRVTPVDLYKNEGSATALDARAVVRIPDAPEFAIAFDEGTTKVTFSEAA